MQSASPHRDDRPRGGAGLLPARSTSVHFFDSLVIANAIFARATLTS